jgi:hypothetical protein
MAKKALIRGITARTAIIFLNYYSRKVTKFTGS